MVNHQLYGELSVLEMHNIVKIQPDHFNRIFIYYKKVGDAFTPRL